MASFETETTASGATRVVFKSDFTMDQTPEFMQFFKTQLEQGVTQWEICMHELEIINSEFIGSLVMLNVSVNNAKGKGLVRYMLKKDSDLHQLFLQSKLDRILNIHPE